MKGGLEMKAEGKVPFRDLPIDISECTPLKASEVARGKVYVKKLYKSENKSTEILLLAPNSCIRYHELKDGSELYDNLSGEAIEICFKGKGHSLQNTSYNKWLIVLSKRW
jgi:hypothetical protein